MGETLQLATLHNAVLEFLRGRDDVVLAIWRELVAQQISMADEDDEF